MLSHEQFLAAVAQVPCAGGWKHAPLLHGLVRWLKPAAVVEVGTYLGHSACWLARALQENGGEGELYCIDDWSLSGLDSRFLCGVHLGLCQVNDRVTVIDGKSDAVEWPACDLAFIDGDHWYAGCKGDVERAIAAGARCIAVHDVAAWWGPRRWLQEFDFRHEWRAMWVPFDGGLAVAMKCDALPDEQFTQREYPTGAVV